MMRYHPCVPLANQSSAGQQFVILSSNCDKSGFSVIALGHSKKKYKHNKKIKFSVVNTLSFEPRKECISSKYDMFTFQNSNFQNSNLNPLNLPPEGNFKTVTENKKLLVLDLNGVLADVTLDFRKTLNAPKYIEKKAVFKRPFSDDFLNFCFENFNVGIWSSRRKNNLVRLVDYLMGDMKHNLLFCWDASKCTNTGFTTIGNLYKPLMLKEMKKLWTKEENDLPWEKGQFSPSNTLLIDDSPYKALCNPPFTAIFPYPYDFRDENDDALENGGYFREYLEELALADDVRKFVQKNPFGQRPISNSTPCWKFYKRVMKKIKYSNLTFSTSSNQIERKKFKVSRFLKVLFVCVVVMEIFAPTFTGPRFSHASFIC